MRFYTTGDSISAQIEACALLNLRFGGRCAGLAYPRAWQALRSKAWGWRGFLPRVSLSFFVPPHQNDKRIWFELRINRGELCLAVDGPRTNRNLHSARDIGLTLRYGSRWVTFGPFGVLHSWAQREALNS